MNPRPLLPALLLCLGLCAPLPMAVAEGLPDLGESAQADLSPLAERRIGESIINQIRTREPGYVNDPEINGYLNRLGTQLAAQSEGGAQSFEFFALRDPTLNAFAMPGGFIGVHTGLILAALSESELASVLAHEISHVTQRHLARLLNKSAQGQTATLLALAVAILAARNNGDLAMGAMMAGQAAGIQNQLNYSRDFEREADRFGVNLLERSGYDVRGMSSFFERLQKVGRLYENNAPGYLRSHPLTVERISDMENRIQGKQYKQVPDSLEFKLVRAKLRAQLGAPQDAVADFEVQLKEGKFVDEVAVRYGLAQAQLRAGNLFGLNHEVVTLRQLKATSPMIETLAAESVLKQGDAKGAAKLLAVANGRYPQDRAISYAWIEALQQSNQAETALKVTLEDLALYPSDSTMHALQAKTYAALGRRLQQHRAQAESYALLGQTAAAVIQMELAQKAGDGNFYEQSQVDARLRELKKIKQEEDLARRKEARQ